MRLLIVRHSKAEDTSLTGRDFDRNLTEKGINRAHALGKELLTRKLIPEFVFSSPLNRAIQTAHILAEHVFNKSEIAVISELEPDTNLFRSLKEFLDTEKYTGKSVMIVGHQPELGYLVEELALHAEKVDSISPGTLVAINLSSWRKHSGKIELVLQGREF